MFAIIGGTGLGALPNLEITRRQVVRTPYGETSSPLTFGVLNGRDVVFMARHGYGHRFAPHEVNYRANIWALAEQKVKCVIAVASVGGVRADLPPGTLVVPDQILDYTWGRSHTFFEGGKHPVTHVDFTEPYDAGARAGLLDAARHCGEIIVDGATYAATQGPRLETAAEIRRLEGDGADIVGMTGMPEAALAREAGLAYATLGVVVNFAAGKGSSTHGINMLDANTVLTQALPRIFRLLGELSV